MILLATARPRHGVASHRHEGLKVAAAGANPMMLKHGIESRDGKGREAIKAWPLRLTARKNRFRCCYFARMPKSATLSRRSVDKVGKTA